MSPPTPSPRPDPRPPAPVVNSGPEAHRRRGRKLLLWSAGISVGVHLILVALYPIFMASWTPPLRDAPDRDRPELGMEVVLLDELPDLPDPDPADEPPEEEPPPELPDPDPEPEPEPDPADEPAADPAVAPTPLPADEEEEGEPGEMTEEEVRRHVAELLQPQVPDSRLWRFGDQPYMEMTDEERAQLMLAGMLRDWNDSVAVAAALSERAMDWTYTDDEGRRWGLSPGRLHLGDYAIPLPFTFTTPPGLRDRADQQRWINEDLARGAASQMMRETWAERAREIRRRMDEERARERGGG